MSSGASSPLGTAGACPKSRTSPAGKLGISGLAADSVGTVEAALLTIMVGSLSFVVQAVAKINKLRTATKERVPGFIHLRFIMVEKVIGLGNPADQIWIAPSEYVSPIP
jgi:hypothetical protein